MKKLLPLLLIFVSVNAYSQISFHCGSARFDTEVFPSVQITSDIIYGSNNVAGGGPIDLTMDIYEPAGDTMATRPLIVWAHGGSFIGGTKNDVDIVALCNRFAKRGYVCASINYRTGFAQFPPTSPEAKRAVYRAMQDMKAAVRFFRKDAATTNTYKINTGVIFGGGSSAGAFMALHLAYMDEPSEIPTPDIDTNLLGGLEGSSGNPGYSSEIDAVVNLCGAIGDKTFMKVGDEPVVSMHGTNDGTVPYATDIILMFGIVPVMQVDGSYSLTQYANTIGLSNDMYTFYGQDHVPYYSNTASMDTTVLFVSNFLYRRLGCTPLDSFPQSNTIFTSVGSVDKQMFSIGPNPAGNFIRLKSEKVIEEFTIYDVNGKKVFTMKFPGENIEIDLNAGIYFYRADEFNGKLIFVE